jgi:hypothetical protein
LIEQLSRSAHHRTAFIFSIIGTCVDGIRSARTHAIYLEHVPLNVLLPKSLTLLAPVPSRQTESAVLCPLIEVNQPLLSQCGNFSF